jgi:hypothetical protein
MKIYEYNFNNTNLPLKLKSIVNNYKRLYSSNRIYNKFLYSDLLNLKKTKIFTLMNKSNNMVSYTFLFKVKKEYEKTLNLPNQTYIIREVETLPQFRRKGYCKKLMNWINNYYKDKFIYLEVNGTNTAALKCYSFLKSYTNNNLQVYYDKFHLETMKWINSMDSTNKQYMLTEMPHIISKFILFSN